MIYEYKCKKCGKEYNEEREMGDTSNGRCECGGITEKVFSNLYIISKTSKKEYYRKEMIKLDKALKAEGQDTLDKWHKKNGERR